MPSPLVEQQYRAPADILEKQREILGIKTPPVALVVSAAPLIGTWMNVDHATRSLVRVMIAASGNEITVHGFGACVPNPCDWGQVNGIVYSDSVATAPGVAFTASYTFSFKVTTMVGHLQYGALFVETFDHFTDNSGRADYYSMNIMTK
jgi:hypothetical protein